MPQDLDDHKWTLVQNIGPIRQQAITWSNIDQSYGITRSQWAYTSAVKHHGRWWPRGIGVRASAGMLLILIQPQYSVTLSARKNWHDMTNEILSSLKVNLNNLCWLNAEKLEVNGTHTCVNQSINQIQFC